MIDLDRLEVDHAAYMAFATDMDDEGERLLDTLPALLAEVRRLYRLLEGLTPGGSEFYDRPDRCAQWAADEASSRTRILVEAKAEVHRLREALGVFARLDNWTWDGEHTMKWSGPMNVTPPYRARAALADGQAKEGKR